MNRCLQLARPWFCDNYFLEGCILSGCFGGLQELYGNSPQHCVQRFTEQELIGDVELSEDNPDLAQIDEEELLSDPPM